MCLTEIFAVIKGAGSNLERNSFIFHFGVHPISTMMSVLEYFSHVNTSCVQAVHLQGCHKTTPPQLIMALITLMVHRQATNRAVQCMDAHVQCMYTCHVLPPMYVCVYVFTPYYMLGQFHIKDRSNCSDKDKDI